MIELMVATGFIERLRGLKAHRARRAWGLCALLFPRCNCVHTFGMRSCIDVAFADRTGRVLAVHRALPPWRVRGCRGAFFTLERFAEGGPWIEEGEQLCAFALAVHDECEVLAADAAPLGFLRFTREVSA